MNISNISILNITLGIHYIIRSSIRFNIMMEHIFHPFEAYLTISISGLTQIYVSQTNKWQKMKNRKMWQKRHKSTTKETKTLSTDCSTAGLKASSGAWGTHCKLGTICMKDTRLFPHLCMFIMMIITMIMVSFTSTGRK